MKPYLVHEIITEPMVTVGELRGGESSLLKAIVRAIGDPPHGGQTSRREEADSPHRKAIPLFGGWGPAASAQESEEHQPVVITPPSEPKPNRIRIPL